MLKDTTALPVMAQHPHSAHGVVSHSFAAALEKYTKDNPDGLLAPHVKVWNSFVCTF